MPGFISIMVYTILPPSPTGWALDLSTSYGPLPLRVKTGSLQLKCLSQETQHQESDRAQM